MSPTEPTGRPEGGGVKYQLRRKLYHRFMLGWCPDTLREAANWRAAGLPGQPPPAGELRRAYRRFQQQSLGDAAEQTHDVTAVTDAEARLRDDVHDLRCLDREMRRRRAAGHGYTALIDTKRRIKERMAREHDRLARSHRFHAGQAPPAVSSAEAPVAHPFRATVARFGPPSVNRFSAVYQGVDPAIRLHARADWFAVVTIGLAPPDYVVILHAYRGRHSFDEQANVLLALAARWNPRLVGIEANGYQAALVQHLHAATTLPARAITVTESKVARAWRLAARLELATVEFVPGTEWLAAELMAFPGGRTDDGVDALDHAMTVAAADARRAWVGTRD